MEHAALRDRVRGMLLGGAVGDAFGAMLEFLPRAAIVERYGPNGPDGFVSRHLPPGWITDDTQMTLFTAEGLIRARVAEQRGDGVDRAAFVHRAYLRWLTTQGAEAPEVGDGWLIGHEFLHEPRAPGKTCITALRGGRARLGQPACNDSKGCGTVMRTAPVALVGVASSPDRAFDEACVYGGLTHAHPTGKLAAGYLTHVLALLLGGTAFESALAAATEALRGKADHAETLAAVQTAERLARDAGDPAAAVRELGQGWIAEEALAIGLYAALVGQDWIETMQIATVHDGDSDSTGAVAGNLRGAIEGEAGIPPELLEELEGRDVIAQVADDLIAAFGEDREDLATRYPGR